MSDPLLPRADLGPPYPIPSWLAPIRSPLGPEDLRMVPSTKELRTMVAVLDHEQLAGWTMVTHRDGSPWVEFDVVVPFHGEARDYVRPEVDGLPSRSDRLDGLGPGGTFRFAIWRYTCKAYRVDHHGAVEDDPIELDDV